MPGNKRRPMEVRFWEKVEMGPSCWTWRGAKDKKGYGRIAPPGGNTVMVLAHRFSWELHFGPIPKGPPRLVVMHLVCDNPSCVNPGHLALGTYQQNSADCIQKNRHNHGTKQHMAKLDDIKAAEILRRYRSGETRRALCAEFEIGRSTIDALIRRRTWKHVVIKEAI